MIAAGVPSRNSLLWTLGGAALVLAILGGTSALLKINFEREPVTRAARLTAGADIGSSVGVTTTLTDRRDSIPRPDEVTTPAPIEAHDLPSAPPAPPKPSAPVMTPSFSEPTPVVAATPPEPPKTAPKQVDKSEVF
jgi:hypothetical protein